MIEIVVTPTRDRADAPDPESAVVAARTLLRDAREHGAGKPTAAFYVAGKLVRCDVTERSLSC